MTREALQALLERLNAAEGPDREIDAEIECLFLEEKFVTHKDMPSGFIMMDAGDKAKNRSLANSKYISKMRKPSERYTASLDASIALVERMLPEWSWTIENWKLVIKGAIEPQIEVSVSRDKRVYGGNSLIIPIALLTALIKALIAEREEK